LRDPRANFCASTPQPQPGPSRGGAGEATNAEECEPDARRRPPGGVIDFSGAPYAPAIHIPADPAPFIDEEVCGALLPGIATHPMCSEGHVDGALPAVRDPDADALLAIPQFLPVTPLPAACDYSPPCLPPDGLIRKALPEFGVDRGKLLAGMLLTPH